MEDQLVDFTKEKKFLEDRKLFQECMEAYAQKAMKKTASTKKKVVCRPLRRVELEKEFGALWNLPKEKKSLWPDEKSNKRKSIGKPDRQKIRATIRTSTSTQLRTATTKSSRTPNLNRRSVFDKSVPSTLKTKIPKIQFTIVESLASSSLEIKSPKQSNAKTTRCETDKILRTMLEQVEAIKIDQKKIQDKFDQFIAPSENKPETEQDLISFNDSGCLALPLTPNRIVPPVVKENSTIEEYTKKTDEFRAQGAIPKYRSRRLEENAKYSPNPSVLDDSVFSPLPDCAKLIRGNVSTPQSTTLTHKVVDETMKEYNDLRKRVPFLCSPKRIQTDRTAFSIMTPSVETNNEKYISRRVQEQIFNLENDE